jgi:hypothetical protein
VASLLSNNPARGLEYVEAARYKVSSLKVIKLTSAPFCGRDISVPCRDAQGSVHISASSGKTMALPISHEAPSLKPCGTTTKSALKKSGLFVASWICW